MEALYVEVLYTVFHKVGAQQHAAEDLPLYAQTAFHIEPQDHLRLQAVAQEEKVSRLCSPVSTRPWNQHSCQKKVCQGNGDDEI